MYTRQSFKLVCIVFPRRYTVINTKEMFTMSSVIKVSPECGYGKKVL